MDDNIKSVTNRHFSFLHGLICYHCYLEKLIRGESLALYTEICALSCDHIELATLSKTVWSGCKTFLATLFIFALGLCPTLLGYTRS